MAVLRTEPEEIIVKRFCCARGEKGRGWEKRDKVCHSNETQNSLTLNL